MHNDSNDIKFLISDNEELYEKIILSIDQARDVIKDYLHVKHIEPEQVTSGGQNPLKRATIFKFFDGYKSNENRNLFNKEWVETIYRCSEKAIKTDLEKVFSAEGKKVRVTNVYLGNLRSDCSLILHLLWCNKAILLPFKTKLPYGYTSKTTQTNYEYAASTYPELLAIARQPFLDHIEYTYPKISEVIPPNSRDNFNWYFRGFIRSSSWWKVEDITTEDLVSILNSNPAKLNTFNEKTYSLRRWLQYLRDIVPNQCKFDLDEVTTKGMTQGLIKKGDKNFIPEKIRPQINEWLHYMDLWEKKLIAKGIMTNEKKRGNINKLILYFINEIYPKSPKDVPFPKEFSRKHLDGWSDKIQGLLVFLKKDIDSTSNQNCLYDMDSFFKFLESYNFENGFKNILDLRIDAPIVPRRRGTAKKIFPGEYYAPLVSFLYGLSEWVWYMINYAETKEGQAFLLSFDSESQRRFWDTEKSGFTPLLWCDGKYIPIKAIPYSLAPISYRFLKNNPKQRSRMIDPHYIHIITILYETGIRVKHINWLDNRTYDQFVERDNFNPYSFNVSTLHVNTDKTNGEWNCDTSEAVIGLLDRQKQYQNNIINEKADTLIHYDHKEHSPYKKIQCIFYKGLALNNISEPTIGPINEDSIRNISKRFLYAFNITCYKENNFEPFIKLDIPDDPNLQLTQPNEYYSIVFGKDALNNIETKITAHSARSQVVSSRIPFLPPSIIKRITGHVSDAQVVYYVQIEKTILNKYKKDAFDDIYSSGKSIVNIKAEDINSKLRKSFKKDPIATIHDFGASSFSTRTGGVDETILSGISKIKSAPLELIAFNSTHMCPYNNQCPSEVIRDFNVTDKKPCGSCYYSVKTVDHIPRILGQLRKLTDEFSQLDSYIAEARKNGVLLETLKNDVADKKFLSDEIMGWSSALTVLYKMAANLNKKNKWLIEKPEFLAANLQKITEPSKFESLLLKISEAETYAEYFTPNLKAQIKRARMQLLAYSHQFKTMLDDVPDDYTLIDEYKGLIKSICEIANIDIDQLAKIMESPIQLLNVSNQPFSLMNNIKKEGDN